MVEFEPDQPEPCPLNDHVGECESCPDHNNTDVMCNWDEVNEETDSG